MVNFTLYFLQSVFYNPKFCNPVIHFFVEQKHLKVMTVYVPLELGRGDCMKSE